MKNVNRPWANKISEGLQAGFCLAAVALVAAGCSGTRAEAKRKANFSHVITPRAPLFVIGPVALFLTNDTGFSARTELQLENSLDAPNSYTGELLVRGTKLLYAPDSDESNTGNRKPGGYSYIWDVAARQGYVLSEALQAYAPVSSELSVTNIETSSSKAGAQRISGHPCEPATATVRTSDGTTAEFALLRAIDLKGLPLRIQAVAKPGPFTLNLSKVRIEVPPDKVFLTTRRLCQIRQSRGNGRRTRRSSK